MNKIHQSNNENTILFDIPSRPIKRLTDPLARFLHIEAFGGIVLMLCVGLAMLIANSPWGPEYYKFWQGLFTIEGLGLTLSYPYYYWVNDALMVIFFFVIGLEIKREITLGQLNNPKQIALPVIAAIGGALLPAGIYAYLQYDQLGAPGWAIPMATDIAFVVGCLALLGSRVPHGLKTFLLALAIVDDILAVMVIALFYTQTIHTSWLIAAAVFLGLVFLLNRLGVRNISVYVLFGAGMWLCTLKSGIHPTVTGVLLGLLAPVRPLIREDSLLAILPKFSTKLKNASGSERQELISEMSFVLTESVSPLERLEEALHSWVAFVIMPIFALANAGIVLNMSSINNSVSHAVSIGLVIGKPLGIVLFSWIAIKIRVASLPSQVNWRIMIGAGCLAGIGFTMSIFIASLGLKDQLLESAKGGVLVGSLVSMIIGMLLLLIFLPKKTTI